MSVNENKVVIDFKGSFQNASYRNLLKDSLIMHLGNSLRGRELSVSGKDFGRSHKQMTIGYSGSRADQMQLELAFQMVAMTMPAASVTRVSRQDPKSSDTTAYTIETYI